MDRNWLKLKLYSLFGPNVIGIEWNLEFRLTFDAYLSMIVFKFLEIQANLIKNMINFNLYLKLSFESLIDVRRRTKNKKKPIRAAVVE